MEIEENMKVEKGECKKINMTKEQYLINWHDNFVEYTKRFVASVEGLMISSQTTDKDKRAMEILKGMLVGKEMQDIEKDLTESITNGVVKKDTLDKLERLNKDIVDYCIEHLPDNPLWKELLKHSFHIQIEHNQEAELLSLQSLQIPVLN